MKTWKKATLATTVGVVGAYFSGHLIHHFDKLRTIDRMLAELPEGATVLNVGCKNWSWFGNRLSHFNVTNIDIVPRDAPNFVLADIRDLSMFEDNTFDGVYCSHVIEHIPREDVAAAISEMSRVCKDVAGIYIVLPRWWLPTSWMDFEHEWVPVGRRMVASPVKNLGNIGKNIGDTFIRR